VVFNHFAERAKCRPTVLLDSRTNNFYHKSIDTFCFVALKKSVAQNIRGVTERHCVSKGILPSQESDTKPVVFNLG